MRVIDFEVASDVNLHDRLVTLVQQMLDLKRQHAEAEAALSDDRPVLAERITQLDRQIDRLVYELYSLTDDEIAIIEGQV